jgi:hypothetical protein
MTQDYFWPRWTVGQLHLLPKLLEITPWIPAQIPALSQPPKDSSTCIFWKHSSLKLDSYNSHHPWIQMVLLLFPFENRKLGPVTSVEHFTLGKAMVTCFCPTEQNPSGFVQF